MAHGRKLVTQIVRTQVKNKKTGEMIDCIVPSWTPCHRQEARLPEPLVMIHWRRRDPLVTEVGIAYLYRAKTKEERKELIAAVAGQTALGKTMTDERRNQLPRRGQDRPA
jgi:malonate decarboxylase alpha subunit